jgi:hypothetical protein
MILTMFNLTKEGRWAAKFRAKYPYADREPSESGKLRLILGVGRSGTSWVSKVLSKTTEPSRFFSEPLFHIHPQLPYRERGDHTAIGYNGSSDAGPLLAAYQLVAHRQFDGAGLPGGERNDAGWKICLVKEVHALLGTEAVLRAWKVPVVFILRDPVYILDSLFAAQTLETIYLDHEVLAVQEKEFLDRFAGGTQEAVRKALADNARWPRRRRVMLDKVICVQLLQRMFSALAVEFPRARTFAYEEFCERPMDTFQAAARALSIPWDETMAACLQESMRGDADAASNPYAVLRNTAVQKNREFKFLSPEETALCRSTLEAIAPRS